MNITHKTYHTLENRYLTGSRMKDFLKCKRYFYELHISGERIKKGKEAFVIGSAVDTWLTRGKDAFKSEYLAVSRRNIKNPPTDYTELTMAQYDDISVMCKVVEKQPAYLELKDHTAQEIIKCDMPIGDHFCGLSFIPDWYKIDGDTCIITDLKTAQDASEMKYHWHCVSYGYYEQMAVATLIFREINKDIKNFVYRHLIIEKDPDGVPVPYTYFLDNERVEIAEKIITGEVMLAIAIEKDFKPKSVEWKGSPTIGKVDNDWD